MKHYFIHRKGNDSEKTRKIPKRAAQNHQALPVPRELQCNDGNGDRAG